MASIVKKADIDKFFARFPVLVEMGLVDEGFAIAVAGADLLGCRPCDVRTIETREDGSVLVERIS